MTIYLQETQLADAQNEHARVLLRIEQENKKIKDLTVVLDSEKLADISGEKEFNNLEANLNRLETSITRKQCLIDNMSMHIAELSKRNQVL